MTDSNQAPGKGPQILPPPPPQHAYPPYGQQQHAYYAQYSVQPPAPKRPPLTRREKRGAFWAGAIGFNVLTIGFTLVIVPLVAALFAAFFSFIVGSIARNAEELSTGFLTLIDTLRSIDVGLVAIVGISVVVVGLAVMTGAIFASRALLRGHGVKRYAAVTWSGAGIAIVATWVLGWIPGLITQFVSIPLSATGADGLITGIAVGSFGLILGIIFTGAVGWLSWWWMAHAFRPAADIDFATPSEIQE